MEPRAKGTGFNTSRSALYTVGHGNRGPGLFVDILKAYGVEILVDIRSYPRSKRNPHFDAHHLADRLARSGIRYLGFKGLGGFRKEGRGVQSPHTALESPGFRNYADYMLTATFKENIRALLKLVSTATVCLLCAETRPRQCHRWYLSDHLVANGVAVVHLIDVHRAENHRLSECARVDGNHVIYDRMGPQQQALAF